MRRSRQPATPTPASARPASRRRSEPTRMAASSSSSPRPSRHSRSRLARLPRMASYASSAAGVFAAGTGVLEVSINGGDKISIQLSDTSTKAAVAADITTAINNNATLKAAGLTAVTSANGVTFASGSGTNFRVNVASATAATFDLKWGAAGLNGIGASSAPYTNVLTSQPDQIEASGAAQTGLGANNDVFSFSKLVNAGDQQTLSFSAKDSTGALQATSITLTTANAGSLDAAISAINTQLQSNST